MPMFTVDPNKVNWLAQNFDPAPFASELDRVSQLGTNFMTMQAPAGSAQPPQGTADFSSLINGESGGMPAAAAPGQAPLPAAFMQQAMQQPQVKVPPAPAVAPPRGKAPQLPGVPPRPNPVMDLGSILFGKRGF